MHERLGSDREVLAATVAERASASIPLNVSPQRWRYTQPSEHHGDAGERPKIEAVDQIILGRRTKERAGDFASLRRLEYCAELGTRDLGLLASLKTVSLNQRPARNFGSFKGALAGPSGNGAVTGVRYRSIPGSRPGGLCDARSRSRRWASRRNASCIRTGSMRKLVRSSLSSTSGSLRRCRLAAASRTPSVPVTVQVSGPVSATTTLTCRGPFYWRGRLVPGLLWSNAD